MLVAVKICQMRRMLDLIFVANGKQYFTSQVGAFKWHEQDKRLSIALIEDAKELRSGKIKYNFSIVETGSEAELILPILRQEYEYRKTLGRLLWD